MSEQFTRREFLTILAEAGLLAALGGLGCISARPTKPTRLFASKKGERIALVNAKIVDVEQCELLQNKAVVICDGLIESILDMDTPELANLRLFDCHGYYLIPGLINAHCHITSASMNNVSIKDFDTLQEQIVKNYEDAICWGITTVRDMCAIPKIILRDREAIDRGELLGPHILTPLSFVSVPNGYPDLLTNVNFLTRMIIGSPILLAETPEQARDSVKKLKDQGADFIKIAFDHISLVYGRDKLNVLSDAQVEAIKDEATKNGMAVAAHHLYSQGLDRGLAFNIDSMEHIASDLDLTDEQIKKILDTKIPIVPTATVGVTTAFKSEGDPYNDYLEVTKAIEWRQNEWLPEMPMHSTAKVYERTLETVRFYENGEYALEKNKKLISFKTKFATRGLVVGSRNLSRLIKEGAVIGVGNDSGIALMFCGMLHFEMELLKRLGMSDAQVLRAATVVNARIAGIDDKCGSVAKGKRADIVLLGGDPLIDIKNVTKVKAVFKRGELVSKADDFSLDL